VAWLGRARFGRAGLGKARYDAARRGGAGRGWARQGKTRQGKASRDLLLAAHQRSIYADRLAAMTERAQPLQVARYVSAATPARDDMVQVKADDPWRTACLAARMRLCCT